MNASDARLCIENGQAILGIELGSTRIKAVLTDPDGIVLASGNHDWENRLENGYWTYATNDVWAGLQDSYRNLAADVKTRYNVTLTRLGAIGISAMMHGYMAFDKDGKLLVPFRTWRNTTTAQAAESLTERFGFNIPQRWSIAHLEQAILNGEDHVDKIDYLTTLAGYVHWKLTGERVLSIGDASGMFPIDSDINDYDAGMAASYDELLAARKLPWRLRVILPKVLVAGESAGVLTQDGAKLLDPTGALASGIPLCPPEGDAGTGMVATNSVAQRTGNVSAGTSIFAMVVLEKALSKVHPEIDMVTTPTGKPVAMVHCNNCTSDLNAWMGLFREFSRMFGLNLTSDELYGNLFRKALEGDADCGGLMSCNFISGEPVVGFEEGRPLFTRTPDGSMTLANFMRTQLYATFAALTAGMVILTEEEKVQIDRMLAHGGLFKTQGVAQGILASAINAPVSVMENAGEGGAWGVALLAGYLKNHAPEETLEDYLQNRIFAGHLGQTMEPDPAAAEGYKTYMKRFFGILSAERALTQDASLQPR